ncbi:MAG: hypothetical protein ACE5JQ_01840 [Candidatus Methylomirabilales bacterium]
MWRCWVVLAIGGLGLLLAACGASRVAWPGDAVWDEFRRTMAQRQVARRRDTYRRCLSHGVVLPEKYLQQGGGMLEDYVSERPPCGLPAPERMGRAEADFRATWHVVMGGPVPLGYEWLLTVKRRLAAFLDAEDLTPAQARTSLREAQWLVAEWDRRQDLPARAEQQPGGAAVRVWADLNRALNRALAAQGITCRRGEAQEPCF